MIKLIHMVTYS